jgi:hypothetical protein
MNMVKRTALGIAGLFVVLALGGCSTPAGQRLESAFSIISSAGAATVDPQAIIVAASVFDGVQATATQYLRLKRCTPATRPICREPRATRPIINAVRAGRKARNAVIEFLKTHPGQLGPSGLYEALQASISTIQSIYLDYNVEAAVLRR